MTELKLKPCPFCGGDVAVVMFATAREQVPRYRIKCDCGIETTWDFFSVDEIVAYWNRRVDK